MMHIIKSKYTRFVEGMRKLRDTTTDAEAFDWVVDFCENNDLIEEFVLFKFNPSALYAWCVYKSEHKSIKWLKKVITTIVNK